MVPGLAQYAMRVGRGERERFTRFSGRRRVWRLGGGVPCEEGASWRRAVGGLASATEIDDGVEEARWVCRGSSTEAVTGEVGPSKRRRSTASAPHSSPPDQLPLSANAPARYVSPACCDLHLDLHVVAAVSWPAMALFVALHCLLVVLRGVVAVDVPLAVL
jgi:hypothetical protein